MADDLLQLPTVVVEPPCLIVDVPAEKIELRSHDKLELLFNVYFHFCDVISVRNYEWEARPTPVETGVRRFQVSVTKFSSMS